MNKLQSAVQSVVSDIDDVQSHIKNKGSGAGGANTNVNGLSYEDKTDLAPYYESCVFNKKEKHKIIKFIDYSCEMINANKSALHKYMEHIHEMNTDLQPASGCKEPDEAYIDLHRKYIFIIEKKFQQTPGSVDEKIQTAPFKREHYSELFPNFKVVYLYCLSDWFKRDEYASVLKYLHKCNIPIFWGNSIDYKQQIIQFMCEYDA